MPKPRQTIDRRVSSERRKKQRRKIQATAGLNPLGMATVEGPKLSKGKYFTSDLGIGRRKWSRQRKWPEELERRTYDPNKVYVISKGKKITTTRRRPVGTRDSTATLVESDRRTTKRRKNKKLARQIRKAEKTAAKANK